MAKNIFKENIIKASSKRLEEIGKAVSLKNLAFFSFLFSFLALGITGASYRRLPEKIPLFYTRAWGGEQLAQKQLFFLVSGLMLVFSLLNFCLARILLKSNNFLPMMLGFFSFFLCLIGLIGVVKIVILMI